MSQLPYPPGPRYRLLGPGSLRIMRDPPNALLEIARKYGDITFMRIGPIKVCILNHPRYVKEVLVTRHREFSKGGAFHLAKSVLGNGLLTSDGEFHLRQRRLAQPAFHPHRLAAYSRTMIGCARQVRDRWQDGATIEVFNEMSHTTLTIAAQALFGVGIEGQTEEVREALTDVLENWKTYLLPLAHLCHRLRLPLPVGRQLKRARERLDRIIYRVIEQKRAAGEGGDDLLSTLVHATEDGAGMTDLQLRDEAMTFMLAGHETMATTLTWTWYELSRHPEISQRFHAEIDRELEGREPTFEDLPKLQYTKQIFAETLRLYPALWNFSRRALHDVTLGPYRIPKGCQVMTSPFIVHRHPELFPEPLKFDPDRWAPGRGDDRPDLAYFPFSGGVRRCIGEPFAWAEGPLVLATLARRWRMSLIPGQTMDYARAFILRPRHGLKMRLHERRASAGTSPGPQPRTAQAAS